MVIVQNIKNRLSALIKNENFIELFDVDGNSLILFIGAIEELEEGVKAQPDGSFLLADGTKVIVEGGVVTKVEKPVVEEAPVEEASVEAPVEEVVENVVDPAAEVEALKSEIESLKATIENLTKENEATKQDLQEATECLHEVQNFYSNVQISQAKNTDTAEKSNFRLIK